MLNLLKVIILFISVLFLFNCSDVNKTPDSGAVTADISNDVITNVGAVTEIVTTDVLDELTTILGGIADDVSDQSGIDVGSKLMAEGSNATDYFQVAIAGTESCTEGGTKTISGTLDYVHENSLDSGSISGSFTTTYADCQDTVVLSPSDQDCGTTPSVNGDLQTVFSVSYAFTSGKDSSFTDSLSSYYLTSETNSDGNLAVAVASAATEQTFSFDYTLSGNSTSTNLSGTVRIGGQSYSVTDVSDFISSSTSSIVCTADVPSGS